MLASKRQAIILDILQIKGSVQVEELAQELNVSTMTIRRDLDKLQSDNALERCHGGAVAKKEVIYSEKQISNMGAKEHIAQIGKTLVSPGDIIFFDAGTTTYEIAKAVLDIPDIQIVTNDLTIARLVTESEVPLYLCGGFVQKETGSVFDYYARLMLQDFHFDVGFFGTASINENFEVMTPTVEKLWIKRNVPKQCAKSYLAADASKYNKSAMVTINHLNDYTGIITNKIFSEDEKKLLEELHVTILTL